MTPKLYPAIATHFQYGSNLLKEIYDCRIVEELNGAYELTMECSKDYADILQIGKIIGAKPNSFMDIDAFRIYYIGSEMDRLIVKAIHITNDLNYVPISRFRGDGIRQTIALINDYLGHYAENPSITISTDFTTTDLFVEPAYFGPCSIYSIFDKLTESIYGGAQLRRYGWNVNVLRDRTAHRDYTLYVGKSIYFLQNIDGEKRYNAVFPYWKSSSGTYNYWEPPLIPQTNASYPIRAIAYDPSTDYDVTSAQDFGRFDPQTWINENREPAKNMIQVNVLNLDERVYKILPGDLLTIIDEGSSKDTQSWLMRVSKVEYDVLRERTTGLGLNTNIPRVGDIIWTR